MNHFINNPSNSKYTKKQIARGQYLVMSVSKCVEYSNKTSGSSDQTKHLIVQNIFKIIERLLHFLPKKNSRSLF